jgi:hypothetical protein
MGIPPTLPAIFLLRQSLVRVSVTSAIFGARIFRLNFFVIHLFLLLFGF